MFDLHSRFFVIIKYVVLAFALNTKFMCLLVLFMWLLFRYTRSIPIVWDYKKKNTWDYNTRPIRVKIIWVCVSNDDRMPNLHVCFKKGIEKRTAFYLSCILACICSKIACILRNSASFSCKMRSLSFMASVASIELLSAVFPPRAKRSER